MGITLLNNTVLKALLGQAWRDGWCGKIRSPQGESPVRVRKAHGVPGVGARGPVETDKHKE